MHPFPYIPVRLDTATVRHRAGVGRADQQRSCRRDSAYHGSLQWFPSVLCKLLYINYPGIYRGEREIYDKHELVPGVCSGSGTCLNIYKVRSCLRAQHSRHDVRRLRFSGGRVSAAEQHAQRGNSKNVPAASTRPWTRRDEECQEPDHRGRHSATLCIQP